MERDFEWTVQKHFQDFIKSHNLPYEIFHNFPIEKGSKADLAVVCKGTSLKDVSEGKVKAELVIEFKFEPSRHRTDFCIGKLDTAVVLWSEFVRDIERINRFIRDNRTKAAVSVLIDEFGRFKYQEISNESTWIDWGNFGDEKYNISILWTALNEEST